MSLIELDSVQTMSSQEIAQLTGKEHRNVLRDIRAMLDELNPLGGVLSFEQSYTHPQNGLTYVVFNLDREHTDCLLTGYSAKARMLVIKRWHELEAQQAPQLPDFSNPAASARAWAEQYEEKQALQEKIAIAAPKVEHFDLYVARDGLRNLTDVAKSMGLSAVKLGRLLREHGMAFKRTDKMVWSQWFIDKEYGVMKQVLANEKDRDQPMITNAGDVFIKQQFGGGL